MATCKLHLVRVLLFLNDPQYNLYYYAIFPLLRIKFQLRHNDRTYRRKLIRWLNKIEKNLINSKVNRCRNIEPRLFLIFSQNTIDVDEKKTVSPFKRPVILSRCIRRSRLKHNIMRSHFFRVHDFFSAASISHVLYNVHVSFSRATRRVRWLSRGVTVWRIFLRRHHFREESIGWNNRYFSAL